MHTLHLPLHVRGKRRGKRKELSKDRKSMLIYTIVKATVFCGRNPMNKTLEQKPIDRLNRNPRVASQITRSTLLGREHRDTRRMYTSQWSVAWPHIYSWTWHSAAKWQIGERLDSTDAEYCRRTDTGRSEKTDFNP